MDHPEVIVIGSVAIDRIMNFSGQYRDLIDQENIEILSVSVLVDTLEIAEGGTGGNISSNLARLGENPILLSSVGNDAKSYVDRLSNLGVNSSKINFSKLPTASFNVLTDSAENQVGGFYPGAMSDSDSLSLDVAGNDSLVWLSAYDPKTMRRICDEAKQKGNYLFYDPGQQITNISPEDVKAGIEAATGLIVNEYEYRAALNKTGFSHEDLLENIDLLVVTHGKHGSKIFKKDQAAIDIEPVKPTNIVDPTGAGDAYRSGFMYGYLRQWDLVKSGRLGSVMASFALEQHGPQAEITKEQIAARFKENFKEEL
mgnify:CR=1 FL=1